MSAGPLLPPLPSFDNEDIDLALFIHDSARRPSNHEFGETRRFQIIGQQVMEFVVTDHYFTNRFELTLSHDVLQAEKNKALSEENYTYWFEQYRLERKFLPSPGTTPFQTHDEIKDYFHRVVGAIYYCRGMEVTKGWIITLVDPNYHQPPAGLPPSYVTSPAQSTAPLPPQPSSPPPPTPSSATMSGLPSLPILALVNQAAAQLRMDIRYDGEATGPPHQPNWTVKCMIQGTEQGRGTGRSQKAAKEEAARQAWVNMGWGGRG